MRIEASRLGNWKKFFKAQGLDLSNGIRVAVNKFIRDATRGGSSGEEDTLEKIDQLIESITKLETMVLNKEHKIEALDYPFQAQEEMQNYLEIKEQVYQKLETYGCLGIIPLSQLVNLPGEKLLLLLKKMKNEPDSRLMMNKNFEWCLK